MNGHALSRQTVERIKDVLAHFPEVRRAALFGSRAKGTAKPASLKSKCPLEWPRCR